MDVIVSAKRAAQNEQPVFFFQGVKKDEENSGRKGIYPPDVWRIYLN
jgi:hypothetical protein